MAILDSSVRGYLFIRTTEALESYDVCEWNGSLWEPVQALNRYWTKDELSATGGTNDRVDWSQIANIPAFGSENWLSPVNYRVLGTGLAVASAGTADGDFYFDDSGNLFKYDGSVWNDTTLDASESMRVIDFSTGNNDILTYQGGSWVDLNLEHPNTNDAVLVGDDGDGKGAQYYYTAAGVWTKISDVDWAPLTDINELQNVNASGAVDGDLLIYNASAGEWQNSTMAIGDLNNVTAGGEVEG